VSNIGLGHQGDDRGEFIGETTQAEALPPNLLAAEIRSAIEVEWNDNAAESVLDRERRGQDFLREQLTEVRDLIDGGAA